MSEKPTYTTRVILSGYDKQAPEAERQTSIVLMQQDGTDFYRANIKRGPDLPAVLDKGNNGEWMDAKINVAEGKAPTILLSVFKGKDAPADDQYINKGVLFFNNQNRDGTKEYDSTVVSLKDENDRYTNMFVKSGAEFLREKGFDIRVKPKAPANDEPSPS